MSTKLLVVRHGHVAGIDPPTFRGRRDLPLTAMGLAQAQAVAERLRETVSPKAVYASPLSRTMVTAEKIASRFGLDVRREDALIDIDYGEWHGLTLDEARTRWIPDGELWLRAPHLAAVPGGESLAEVAARVAGAIRTLSRRHDGESIVLVAHESINRVIVLHALDLSLSHYWTIDQRPCCINEIDAFTDRFAVVRVNDCAHLESAIPRRRP